nr:MAG TPA: hypothetical protein [Caudoviricetes sp.]
MTFPVLSLIIINVARSYTLNLIGGERKWKDKI